MRVGVLALQGAYAAHARPLAALGHADEVPASSAADFDGIDGLVLPGGESSVHLALIERFGLESPCSRLAREGKPILATCAGLILVAREVASPEQRSLGLLDVTSRATPTAGSSTASRARPMRAACPRSSFARRASRVTPQVSTSWRVTGGEPIWVRQRS